MFRLFGLFTLFAWGIQVAETIKKDPSCPPNDPLYEEYLLYSSDVYSEEKLKAYKEACEKELGEIPGKKTTIEKSARLEITINGKRVRSHPITHKPAYYDVQTKKWSYVEKEYLNTEGTKIIKCDNPSLANVGDPCKFGPDTRLVKFKSAREGVHWVGVQRTGTDISGLIGFNEKTGASCFFATEMQAGKIGKAHGPGTDNCLRCHTGSDPFYVTPNVRSAWDELGVPRRHDGFVQGEYRYHVPKIQYSGLTHMSSVLNVKGTDGTPSTTCTQCHLVTLSDSTLSKYLLKGALGAMKEEAALTSSAWMPKGADVHSPDYHRTVDSLINYMDKEQPQNVSVIDTYNCEKKMEKIPDITMSKAVKRDDNGLEVSFKLENPPENFDLKNLRFIVHDINGNRTMVCLDAKALESRVVKFNTEARKTAPEEVILDIEPYYQDPADTICPWLRGNTERIHYKAPSKDLQQQTRGGVKITH